MEQILVWWFLATLIGWITFPICFRLFQRLPDRGYTFSRSLGLLAATYVLWLGASLHILQNDLGGIAFALIGLLAVSIGTGLRPAGRSAEIRSFIRANWKLILTAELLFALCFFAWALLRAYAVGKIMRAGGEKFMEMAFLNGILQSRQFPPLDPWLSGYAISYYYFGYVMMAVLTRLSGAVSGVAFDLYDALLFGLTSLSAFGLVYNLATASRIKARGALLAGLLGALLTSGMGNLQGLVEALYSRGWLPVGLAQWLAVPDFPAQAQVTGSFYPGSFWSWGWRASRVINDLDLFGQPIALKPITEFPNFSFLLGDNHPHVLGLPFALLAAAAALQMLLSARESSRLTSGSLLRMVGYAWIIGALLFLNTWDFPIYLGLALLAWLAGRSTSEGRITREMLWQTARLGVSMLLCSGLFYGLFLLGFSSQAGGVLPYIFPPTRLAQYLIMFGPFIFILAIFLPTSLILQNRTAARPLSLSAAFWGWVRLAAGLFVFFLLMLGAAGLALWLDGLRGGSLASALLPYIGSDPLPVTLGLVLAQRLTHPWLFLVLSALIFLAAAGIFLSIRPASRPGPLAEDVPVQPPAPVDPSLLFARLLALVGLGLTFSLEFFYLRDGFGVRMNSVFKFYFQGWILMACAAAYAFTWVASQAAKGPARALKIGFLSTGLLLILCGLVYSGMGIFSRTDGFSTRPNLDGTSELRRDNPDDWAAIDWLASQGRTGQDAPILLEAPGTSYTYEGRMSAFTGFPTLLGWAAHELQWRGSYTEQGQREAVIAQIYTTQDAPTALKLLQGYAVNYVILGAAERAYIRAQCILPERRCNPTLAEDKFKRVLSPAFQQGQTTVYRVPGTRP